MTAGIDRAAPGLVCLRHLSPADLAPLFEEEKREWMHRLRWDFTPTAELVSRYVGSSWLDGYALVSGAEVAGYIYFVHDGSKGVIGDLYVSSMWERHAFPRALLEAAVRDLLEVYGVGRVECQLLLWERDQLGELPFDEYLTVFPRCFMVIDLAAARSLPPHPLARHATIVGYHASYQEPVARVIAAAYAGHIDSEVNDQYKSLAGARRFLHNLIDYPGCGQFCQPASFIALDLVEGKPCGVVLASTISPLMGHITQICLLPQARGKGLGYELLRRSLLALAEVGCTQASLTVTAMNDYAVRLYESVGFRTAHEFPALVWQTHQQSSFATLGRG